MVVACCGARVHCTSSMSTWFGGITWLSWPPWGNSQAEVRQRLLKAWAQPSCEALGQSMVKFQWNGLCGGFPYPSSLTEYFHLAIDPLQKNATEQLQTSPDFCDGNWPRTNPYQYSSFAVQLWVSVSAWTPNVMTCHDHLQKNIGMPRPMEVCCFSIYFCTVFFLNQLLLKFSCRRLAGTQHCALNFSLWA